MTWRYQRLWVLSFAIFAFTGADCYAVRTVQDPAQDGLVYSEDWVPLTQPFISEDTATETQASGNPPGSSAPQPQLIGSSNGIVASQNAVRPQESPWPQGSLDSFQSAPSVQGLSGQYAPTSQQQDLIWTGQSSGSQAIALPSQPQRSSEPFVYASQARPLSSSQPQLSGGSLTSPSQGAPLQQLRARLLTGQGASVALSNVRPASDPAQQSGSPYLSMPSQASSTGATSSRFQPGFQSAPSQFPGASSGQYGAPSLGDPSSILRPAGDFAQQSASPFLSAPFQAPSTGQTTSSFQPGFQSAVIQVLSTTSGQYGAPSSSLRPAGDFVQQSGSPFLSAPFQAPSTGQTTSRFQPGFQSAPSQFPGASSGQYGAPQGAGIASISQRPASDFAQQPSQAVSLGQTFSRFPTGSQSALSQFPSASSGQYSAPRQGAPSSSLWPASDFAQQSSQAVSTRQTSSSFQPCFQSAASPVPSAPSGQYAAPQGYDIASSSPRPSGYFAQQSGSPLLSSPSQTTGTRKTSSSFQTVFLGTSSQFPSSSSGQYGAPVQSAPSSSLAPASDLAQQNGSPFLSAPSQTKGTGQTSSSFQPGFQIAFTQLPSTQYMASFASPDVHNQASRTTGAYRWP